MQYDSQQKIWLLPIVLFFTILFAGCFLFLTKKEKVSAAIIDLTQSPFNLVVNMPSAAASNTAAINSAIVKYDGTGSILEFPDGDIYVDRLSLKRASIDLTGRTRLTLAGKGLNSTRLIQQGDGEGTIWDLVKFDGGSQMEIRDMGFKQGVITNPSPIDHNALIGVYAFLDQDLRDVYIHDVDFGQAIGDAVRIGADYHVDGFKLLNFTMRTQGHPQGSRGLGLGSRSGIALQRGLTNIEIGHLYIEGSKNSPIDMEPSGYANSSDILLHDLIINNSLGQTIAAVSITGLPTSPLVRLKMNNVIVKQGAILIAETIDVTLSDVTIYSSGLGPMTPGGTQGKLPLLQANLKNESLQLNNVNIIRDTGSESGQLATFIHSTGKNTSKLAINGGEWRTMVTSGIERAYVEFRGVTKPSILGLRVELANVVTNEYGLKFRTSDQVMEEPTLNNVTLKTQSNKLLGGIYFAATNLGSISNISVQNTRMPRSATNGLIFDLNGGTFIDSAPIVQGNDFTSSTKAWLLDHGAVGNVTPITTGNRT